MAVLKAMAATRPWLGWRVTDAQLLVDVAAGYDVLVVGADKWAQVVDPAWYGGSEVARDDAVARLPARIAVVSRPPFPDVAGPVVPLVLDDDVYQSVSSTAVRNGRLDWMVPEAAEFAARTGAWIDLNRYVAWVAAGASGDDRNRRSRGDQ